MAGERAGRQCRDPRRGIPGAPRLAGRRGDRDETGLSRWSGSATLRETLFQTERSEHQMADADTGPVVVRYADLERRTWGDEEAGRLSDWFYADNMRLNLNIVGMAPNGAAM